MTRYRPTVVEVDLGAIRHNVRALKPASSELMAVVKGNAYGHGDAGVARAALEAGATWLGVALVEEGIRLREAGIDAPILVLSEFPPGSERDAIGAGLIPTVCTAEAVDAVAAAASTLRRGMAVHMKVDTGMHRAGAYPPESVGALARRASDAGLAVEGLWTHFARAEDDEATTREQLSSLHRAASMIDRPRYLHAANSAATILYPEAHLDLVRTGIACYGLEPAPGIGDSLGLRPALSWRSAVTAVRRLPAGEAISYGHRYRLSRDASVATVPVGYDDGYARVLFPRGEVLIRGRRRTIAGNVTMDHLMVDCGDDEIAPGDEVVLLGRQGREAITADELAGLMGTISYEVVTTIGGRVPVEHVNESESMAAGRPAT